MPLASLVAGIIFGLTIGADAGFLNIGDLAHPFLSLSNQLALFYP